MIRPLASALNLICVRIVAIAATFLASSSTFAADSPTPVCSSEELASRAYSPMYLDGTMDVFLVTGPNLTLIATMAGLNKPGELVLTGDGRKIYVNDWGTGTLRVIDACSLTTTKLIGVGSLSISTYIPKGGSSDGRYLYAMSTEALGISVVDTETDTVVRFYPIPGIVGSHLSPDGKRLYVLTAVGVLTLDPSTGLALAPPLLTGALAPTWATTSADGSKLYLADTAGDAMTIVETSTMQIIKTIQLPFGTTPIIVKVTPDGREIWMADGASQQGIVIVSTVTDTLTDIIPTNGMALYVSFSPDGQVAYVAEARSSSNSSHLGVVYLVAAVAGLLQGDGDIRIISTTSHKQIGSLIMTPPVPDDVATPQPGVVSGG
jgi:DNA-binding beta-propeller fold protein YncE